MDVRKFLKIDQTEPVELRICHIADLWYKEVQLGRMRNHLDTLYNLFPELVISEVAAIVDKSGHVADYSPEIDYITNGITAYRVGKYLYQGASGDTVQIINCLYGSTRSPKLTGPANDIQKRISRELCSDISKISSLREYYTRLLAGLSPGQTERFRTVFKVYIEAVMDDLEKFPNYRSPLFPFSSDRLVLELNNYLAEEFNRENYADFFLWLNLGALLRNEINDLMYTYDSSFNLGKEAGNPSGKLKEELGREKENYDLLLRIFENDRNSHPSIRMMDPDPLLFPKGLPEVFSDGRFAVEEEEAPRALRDMILDSWKYEDRRHILLVGEGGIGKTVAMLTLPEEDWFKELGIPVIYVPLQRLDIYEGDLNCYVEEKIGSNNYEHCIELANRASEGHPNLLLLLDGFNEIPDKFKKKAELYIRGWMGRPGIQIITTSRLGLFLEDDFSKYRLQPLPYDTVRSFLLSAGISEEYLPSQKDRIWDVINVPLMLAMYTQIEKVMETADRSSAAPILEWKEPDNAAHIIWDYLQMELYRCIKKADSTYSIVQYAAAIFAVAPYICSQMSRQNKFYIKREEFHGLIQEALIFYTAHQDMLGRQIRKLCRKYDPYHKEDLFHKENMEKYARILLDNVALFQEQETYKEGCEGEDDIDYTSSLMHQNFRDALAAFFICSCLPKACGAKEKKALLCQADHYVKIYMAEHFSGQELVSVWDRHRKEEPEDGQITFILMDLVGRQRNYDYRELDFSGIDLSKTNLHRLLSKRLDICPLPGDGNKLSKTKISVNCLSPNGHAQTVRSVVFSPDGRHIASGAGDRTVRVWDLVGGEDHVLEGHVDWVNSVAYSPDGRHIASGADDRTVRVWDLASGESRVLEGYSGGITSVAYSPDGRYLASGGDWNTVRIWDLTGGENRVLEGHAGWIRSVTFSPDGRQVAGGGSDSTVRIWDLASGENRIMEGHTDRVYSVAYSPDGRHIASGALDGTVRVWDLASGESRVLEGYSGGITSVAYSPDGRHLASDGDGNMVRIWNLASGECRILEGHTAKVSSVAFSPDGRQLASSDLNGTVRIWELPGGEDRVLEGHASVVSSVAYSPDGRHLAGALDGTVRVWDLASGASHVLEGQAGWVRSLAYSPDGRQLVSGAHDGTVRVWDLTSGARRVLEGQAGWVRSLAYSPDGIQLASGGDWNMVWIWDFAGGEDRVLGGHTSSVNSVAYSPDGRHLASGACDRTVRVWDLMSGASRVLEGHASVVSSVAYSPNGRYVASGALDGTARIWDLESDASRVWYAGNVMSVSFSPDGRHLVSGTKDGTVWIWDFAIGEICALEGHTSSVNSVAYSPDGRWLASGGADGTVRIWDMEHYREVRKYLSINHVNLSGANFELAVINEKDKEILRAAGARV